MVAFAADAETDEYVDQLVRSAQRERRAASREAEVYRKAAAAKLKRDRLSYAEYRRVDQREWETQVETTRKLNLESTETEFAEMREYLDECQADFGNAENVFVAAEAASLKADEYAAKLLAEYEAAVQHFSFRDTHFTGEIKVDVPPEDAARMLNDVNTAREVASRRKEALAAAEAEYNDADMALLEVKQDFAEVTGRLNQVRVNAAAELGVAPVSDATIKANAAYMQSPEVWDTLDRNDQDRVRQVLRGFTPGWLAEFQKNLQGAV